MLHRDLSIGPSASCGIRLGGIDYARQIAFDACDVFDTRDAQTANFFKKPKTDTGLLLRVMEHSCRVSGM